MVPVGALMCSCPRLHIGGDLLPEKTASILVVGTFKTSTSLPIDALNLVYIDKDVLHLILQYIRTIQLSHRAYWCKGYKVQGLSKVQTWFCSDWYVIR